MHLTESHRKLLAFLSENPSSDILDAAEGAHLARSTAAKFLSDFALAGLAHRPRRGRYSITDAGRAHLQELAN
ncbi:hypothetical protein TPB0596_32100 [Tsukamurella pulmonis]|nr:hypothetical protein TPB0596_32100 [Tsukamurella pulmonis]